MHTSLNNADHLRYYVDKIQKEIHPQGHGILGVVYNYSQNINNFCGCVKHLGKIKILIIIKFFKLTIN